jgi:hypothetical protein
MRVTWLRDCNRFVNLKTQDTLIILDIAPEQVSRFQEAIAHCWSAIQVATLAQIIFRNKPYGRTYSLSGCLPRRNKSYRLSKPRGTLFFFLS